MIETVTVGRRTISSIVILVAMEQEAAPMIKEFNLERQESLCNICQCLTFSGKYAGCSLYLITNGKCRRYGVDEVGTVPAALSAYVAIKNINPDLIINAGTAGGFYRKSAGIGDTYVVSHIKCHDRRIPIPEFIEYAKGNFDLHETPNLVKALNCKTGALTTSNSLDHTEMDDTIMLENDASVKDMEGAGIAWVAHLANVPLVCIKVITDIVDGEHPTEQEFLKNLNTAAQSLKESLPQTVRYVAGKALDEL